MKETEVYHAIHTEVLRQDATIELSVVAWLTCMQHQIDVAHHALYHDTDPGSHDLTMDAMRRLAALAVACMQQHGVRLAGYVVERHEP